MRELDVQEVYIRSLLLPPTSIIIHQQSTASSVNHHFRPIPNPNSLKTSVFPNPNPTKMQFKSIAAFVSLAVMASALPADNIVARTTPTNQCSSNQTLSCCNSVTDTLVGVQILPIGIGCIALLPGQQCSPGQKTACCNTESQVRCSIQVLPTHPQH